MKAFLFHRCLPIAIWREKWRWIVGTFAVLMGLLLTATSCQASMFKGTLYYTKFTGGVNVDKVDYSYNSTTQSLSLTNKTGIASLAGADGIIFAPDGDLLVGGQSTSKVFKLHPDGTGITFVNPGTVDSFHLALDPSGKKFYTSPFEGRLDIVPLNPFANGTHHNVSAAPGKTGDTGLTQLAFAPNGKVFYSDSNPNGFGNYGLIDLSTFQTTRLGTDIRAVHGLIYDPFTGLMTMFGAGAVATVNPTSLTFKQRIGINTDFDQGSVDGHGHAFIAGNGQITFIDYSATHDITSASNKVIIVNGFSGIDDTAPLVGLGSNVGIVPEPSSLTLLALGGGLLGWRLRRRKHAMA